MAAMDKLMLLGCSSLNIRLYTQFLWVKYGEHHSILRNHVNILHALFLFSKLIYFLSNYLGQCYLHPYMSQTPLEGKFIIINTP